MQGTQRAHILIPADLLREIDAMVGPRGRTAFLLDTAREELRRRKLLIFLESKEPAWKDDSRPGNSTAWVRKMRSESEKRATQAATTRQPGRRKPK